MNRKKAKKKFSRTKDYDTVFQLFYGSGSVGRNMI